MVILTVQLRQMFGGTAADRGTTEFYFICGILRTMPEANDGAAPNPNSQKLKPNLFEALKRLFGTTKHVRTETAKQFLLTLRTIYLSTPRCEHETEEQKQIRQKVKTLLERDFGNIQDQVEEIWEDGYQIEQLMVQLYSPLQLLHELKRNQAEAQSRQLPMIEFYNDRISALKISEENLSETDSPRLRQLLARLINDLQWQYKKQRARAGYNRAAVRRVAWVFLIAFSLFATGLYVLTINPGAKQPKENAALHGQQNNIQ